jgi:MFS family permease
VDTRRSAGIHYGWVIVAAGMVTLGTSLGMIANSFALFIVPVTEELGFTRSQMSLNQTMFSAGAMLIALFWGIIIRRFRLKRLMGIAAFVCCGGYFLYSAARALWMFYAISAALSLAMGLLGFMSFTVIIGNWFTKRRGLAIGLTFMGSGIGGMLFNILGGYLIAKVGWRQTYAIFSVILALTMLPSVLFVVKIKPSDIGRTPYGGEEGDAHAVGAADGLTIREAARSARFYLIALSALALGFSANALNTTIAPHMQSLNYSNTFSANVAAAYMAALAAGKIALGALSDRLGARRAVALALAALGAAFVEMTLARHLIVVPLIVLCAGFGNSFGSVAYPLIAREVYGARDYAAITGVVSSVHSLGGAFGPLACGIIFDRTGSYIPGYAAMAALVFIFGGMLLFSARTGFADGQKRASYRHTA